MRTLRIEALIPEDAVDEAATRVHQLLTREGWVLRRVETEKIDWVDGLDILRETLGMELKDEIKNDFSPIIP